MRDALAPDVDATAAANGLAFFVLESVLVLGGPKEALSIMRPLCSRKHVYY